MRYKRNFTEDFFGVTGLIGKKELTTKNISGLATIADAESGTTPIVPTIPPINEPATPSTPSEPISPVSPTTTVSPSGVNTLAPTGDSTVAPTYTTMTPGIQLPLVLLESPVILPQSTSSEVNELMDVGSGYSGGGFGGVDMEEEEFVEEEELKSTDKKSALKPIFWLILIGVGVYVGYSMFFKKSK